MRHSTRAGISEAVVVVFVFMALALLAPAVICYNLIDAKRSIHQDLQDKIKAEENEVRPAVLQRMRDSVEYGATGFDPESSSNDMMVRTEAARKAADAFRMGQAEGGDVWGDFLAEVKRARPEWEAPAERPANLQQMAVFMIPFVNDMALEERVWQTPEQTATKRKDTADTIGPKLPVPYQQVQNEINEKERKVTTDQGAEDAAFNQESAAINEELARVTAEIAAKDLEGRRFERDANVEIGRLTVQLEEFKRKEAVDFARLSSVGEIFNTSTDGKTAHTRLGSRDGIRAGMHFDVGNKGLHDDVAVKGRVQVRRVWPEMAELEIVDLKNERTPILSGDLLVNPFFRPGRPVIVQIVGPERVSGVMGRTDAVNRIEELGGVVRTAYSTDVDFIVNMGGDLDAPEDIRSLSLARRMDVPVHLAADVFHYLED